MTVYGFDVISADRSPDLMLKSSSSFHAEAFGTALIPGKSGIPGLFSVLCVPTIEKALRYHSETRTLKHGRTHHKVINSDTDYTLRRRVHFDVQQRAFEGVPAMADRSRRDVQVESVGAVIQGVPDDL